MALRLVQANIKAADASALGRFWAAVLGWELVTEAPGVMNVEGPGAFGVDVVTVPDPSTVRYRVHLDLAYRPGLVERCLSLGATPVDVGQGDVPWTVLADPEGNVFCVLEFREIYRDTGPIAALVVDCDDPRAMAGFWGAATDWDVVEVTDDFASLHAGSGPYLEFLRKPGERVWWNRLHLEVAPYVGDDHSAEVDRLLSLGAESVDVGQGDDVSWRVLADPEGNEFCVLSAR
ncbi:VOC family protein [Cryptosporangium phraense]|uniref:VOC family protein n=1 Tax=Cryptosporangium phraense TaxID=2593070 RepID=A0A545AZ28_9ACTN|nr:VOC family protein [Cryptosporangium phraense]TQS46581.1 VOC family protein [Cryptosporangium phraense]